jgi:hypothetical protein
MQSVTLSVKKPDAKSLLSVRIINRLLRSLMKRRSYTHRFGSAALTETMSKYASQRIDIRIGNVLISADPDVDGPAVMVAFAWPP